jgi:hypothetical protein
MHEESDDHVGRHKMEYATPASRTALRMIVVTPATSRMENCRGSNAMLVLLVPARRSAYDLDHSSAGRQQRQPDKEINS